MNQAQTPAELEAVRTALARGRPYGGEAWRDLMINRFDLSLTLRPRGRPRARNENVSRR